MKLFLMHGTYADRGVVQAEHAAVVYAWLIPSGGGGFRHGVVRTIIPIPATGLLRPVQRLCAAGQDATPSPGIDVHGCGSGTGDVLQTPKRCPVILRYRSGDEKRLNVSVTRRLGPQIPRGIF